MRTRGWTSETKDFIMAGHEDGYYEVERSGDVVGWVPMETWPLEYDAKDEARARMAEFGIAMMTDSFDHAAGLSGVPRQIVLKRVLMREESGVEARINGHEFPHYVECTERAKNAQPMWRVELA